LSAAFGMSCGQAKSPLSRLFLLCALVGMTVPGHAASTPADQIEKQPDGVLLHLPSTTLKVQVCSDRIVRVLEVPGNATPVPENDFVVIKSWTPVPFEVKEDSGTVRIGTGRMTVEIDRATGRLQFLDATGVPFLQETAQGGRTLTPGVLVETPEGHAPPPPSGSSVVGQATYQPGARFILPPDEHLFGLGQFQDGLWDWRGIPLELRQLNMQIAVPVLISSKGYGLLWNNASRTDFNSPGALIPFTGSKDLVLTALSAKAPMATGEPLPDPKAPHPPVVPNQDGELPVRPRIVKITEHDARFTSGAAGDYIFCARDADRREELDLYVDGVKVAGVENRWTPRAVVGKITLPANKTCDIVLRGGGPNVKLFAKPVDETLTSFRSDCGKAIDYTVFYGPKLDDVIAGYREATGEAPLWPKWAYGFWQCREHYSSQQEVLDAAAGFRQRHIPVDLIVQDWKYWPLKPWASYAWDPTNYPNPAQMIQQLHDEDIRFMISVWCNPRSAAGNEYKANQAYVNGWIDVFSPKGREIRWKNINNAFFSIGADAWWGDATEPGDPGTDLLGWKTSDGPGDEVTGAYPLFASESFYDGQRAANPEKRVCILTRSSFPGTQRYGAASWSGDICGDWETFRRQIPAGLNFCLTGIPYWTTDCAGFFHPDDQHTSPDYNELLTRWFEWSTFCPVLRIHGFHTATEMWTWLPEAQKNLLAYDRLRHRMLPYNYTLGSQVTFASSTIMRALGIDFAGDSKVWAISDEYMFGPAFLVTPVTEPKATSRHVYLPAGTGWTDFWTGESQPGGKDITAAAPIDKMPLFVRAGSIVPLGPDLQYATEKPADPIELRVYPGADGAFTLYEDEGDSYRYEKGAWATIPMTWNDRTRTLTIGARKGSFPGMLAQRTFRAVVVSPGVGTGIDPAPKATEVTYRGEPITVR